MKELKLKPYTIESYTAGKKARFKDESIILRNIHLLDEEAEYPIVASYEKDGTVLGSSFTSSGKVFAHRKTDVDLFEQPEKHECWVPMFKYSSGLPIPCAPVLKSEVECDETFKHDDGYLGAAKFEYYE